MTEDSRRPRECGTREGSGASGPFTEGYRWEGDDAEALAAVVEAAFDYRGDVTLLVTGGEEVRGYVFNRDRKTADPFIELLPPDGSPARRISYRELRGVAFTGKDTASGHSWEAWVQKYEEKKRARGREAPGEAPSPEG